MRSLLLSWVIILVASHVSLAAYTLSSTNATEGSGPGIDSVWVTASPSTNLWRAASNTNWLRIVTGGGVTNSDRAVFAFQLNAGPMRTGTLTIAGLTVTVRQQGAAAATTLAVTDVGTNTVTFNGMVTPNAGATASSFQYSSNGGWLVSTVHTGISPYCSARSSLGRDHDGNFYICDPDCSRLYKIAATGGVTTWLYTNGYTSRPISMMEDAASNFYVADFWSIRKYTETAGVWSVFAGDPNFTQQNVDGTGTTARFWSILGMAKDSLGGFYVGCAYRIRHVTTNAVVTTLTDQGTNAGQRDGPAYGTSDIVAMIDAATGIAVDDYSGNLYWGEYTPGGTHGIRKLNLDGPGMVTTLAGAAAGFADGTGSVARFQYPMNVFVDKAGSLYVVDAAANNAIRKVTTNGVVTTLNCRDANTGNPASFSQLVGGMMEDDGNLLVIDHGRDRIARVGYGLFEPLTVISGSGLTGTNAVAVTSTISNLWPGTTYYYWTRAANSTSTNQGEILSFTTLSATTTLALASDRSSSGYGEDVTFTATVMTNVAGWPPASGEVVFRDAGAAIGTGTVIGGVATFVINHLELGGRSITAEYPGDFRYFGSTSVSPVVQMVYTGTPRVTVWPTASAIAYSQTLASSALSGGAAKATGTFAWVNSATVPDIGTSLQEVVFIPTDTVRYVTVSGTVSVTVNKGLPNVATWPTAAPINVGDMLSASVLSGASVTPPGVFAWRWSTARPHVGTYMHSVIFTPDDTTRYLIVTGTVSITINPVPTTNVLTSSRNPSATGESVTFNVTVAPVSSNYYAPAGTATFKDGATVLRTGTLSGAMASLTTNGLGAGVHSITVEYPGDVDFLGFTNAPLLQRVDPALVILRNPDPDGFAYTGTILNTQQMVAALFRTGTGRLRLTQAALRLRCDYSGSPPNDSIRCILYDVTTSGVPGAALAVFDSDLINIARSDTQWCTVAFSGPLRDYLLEASRTYALGISIPTAAGSTNRTIKNIGISSAPYTMAQGYTFLRNERSTAVTPNWSMDLNRYGIILTGTEIPRTSTATSVSADVNPSAYGSAVTFSAVVTNETATGTVTFKDGGATIGTGTVSDGRATLTTRFLDVGGHDMTAEYSGDEYYEPSVSSPAYVQTILLPPTVTTLAATDVVSFSATFNGRVNPNGLMVNGFFRYATNAGWLVSTPAGGTNSGYADGVGSAAYFTRPGGVAMDHEGNVFVADTLNCRIRRITPAGLVTTLAGTSFPGYADGTGSMAVFYAPYSVAVDHPNTIVVADSYNHSIRKVTLDGVVTTLAGTNAGGYADGTGYEARFFRPQGVAVDGGGNVFVADTYNHCIRHITPAGVVTTLAGSTNAGYADGTGSAARFYRPQGVAVDSAGNVFVADAYNHCIRQITPAGVVSTLAGTTNAGYADGIGNAAQFKWPSGVAVDGAGDVVVADNGNHRIRLISPDGMVTTLTGTNSGYADGPASTAQFNGPFGVTVDSVGKLYVADYNNNCIRKLVNTLIEPVTTVSAQNGLTGDEAVDLHAGASNLESVTTYYVQALAVSGSVTNYGAILSFTTKMATAITLDSSPNPSTYGSNVTFTSAVSPSDASGSVTFKDGAATLGTGTLSGGLATFATNSLSGGRHDLFAEYSGDSLYGHSVSSPAYTQTVDRAMPGVSVWPAAGSLVAGQALSASLLSGGSALVAGGFAWTAPTSTPPAGISGQSVTFAPMDSGNYTNAVGLVTITVFGGCVQSIHTTNGTVEIRCSGAPGAQYHVDRTTSMTEPVVWTRLTVESPLKAGPDGVSEFIDENPPQATAIVYRLVQSGE